MRFNGESLLCPAGCAPCGDTYWSTGKHYYDCCSSRLCGTPDQARATEQYIAQQRAQGRSIQMTGPLREFVQAEAPKPSPLIGWLGEDFDRDVTRWLGAEALWKEDVAAWLEAETGWIKEQIQAEADQAKAREQDELLEKLRAKAAANKRVVYERRKEAGPVRASMKTALQQQRRH